IVMRVPETTRFFISTGTLFIRNVRTIKNNIPVGVSLVIRGVVLASYLNPLRVLNKMPVDMKNLVVSGTRITMESPRLSGFTSDARAYEVTAAAAAQDLTKPDVVELRDIRARVQMQDKSLMELTAINGFYDTKGETLKLGHNIVITSSTGYEGRLSEAMVDIRKGTVLSEQPVQVKMLQGTLNADRLEITNSGELVRFEGNVDMLLDLNKAGAQ